MIEDNIVEIQISSGFGHNTQKPYVQLLIPKADWMTRMTPNQARELAHNLLKVAEAADTDGYLVGFFTNVIGAGDQHAIAALLSKFREYRGKE